jgi:DHA1 family inner membrane transport protein
MKHVGRRTSGGDTAAAQGLLGAGFTLGFAVGLAATPTAIDLVGPTPPAVVSGVVIGASAFGALLVADTGADVFQPLRAYVTALRESSAAALSLANAVTFGFLIVAGTWYAELLAGSPLPAFPVLVGFALATVVGRAVGGVLAARYGDRAIVGWSLVAQALVLGVMAAAIAADAALVVAAMVVLTGLGFGVPFGPLFALAFTEISPDAGVTLTGMMVVGNVAAIVYPWFVGRVLSATGSFAIGIGSMAVTVGVVTVLWIVTIGLAVTR